MSLFAYAFYTLLDSVKLVENDIEAVADRYCKGKAYPKIDGIGFIAYPCIIEISQFCVLQNWEIIHHELQK